MTQCLECAHKQEESKVPGPPNKKRRHNSNAPVSELLRLSESLNARDNILLKREAVVLKREQDASARAEMVLAHAKELSVQSQMHIMTNNDNTQCADRSLVHAHARASMLNACRVSWDNKVLDLD